MTYPIDQQKGWLLKKKKVLTTVAEFSTLFSSRLHIVADKYATFLNVIKHMFLNDLKAVSYWPAYASDDHLKQHVLIVLTVIACT